MKNSFRFILPLLYIYTFWMIVFIIQKPLFMLFNPIDGASVGDWINVMLHGAKLDFSVVAYCCFIPLLLLLIRVFIHYNIRLFLRIYTIILLIIASILFSVDCILYSYWGFRMDATLIFYLKDFSDSLNSVSFMDVVKFLILVVPYFLILFFLYKYTIDRLLKNIPYSNKVLSSICLVIMLPILIICSRGGISTATANIGVVYYCDNQLLNLAAINPQFSLIYSLIKQEDFSKKYIFYKEDFCKKEFDKLLSTKDDNSTPWLENQRPNVVIILLESFSANFVGAANGEGYLVDNKEVTPCLNRLKDESIVFLNAYSNGMRTDRGVVSCLTGFLAQPDMSIIKYPEKTRSLPSIAKVLSAQGYENYMIYGGDINFANMRSYFFSSMYRHIIDMQSFPVTERISKWGVNDANMFSYCYDKIIETNAKKKPFFFTFLTLSSHEPFDVDTKKFRDPYINSLSYTDSCIGSFISKIKKTSVWNNTLFVFLSDHAYAYSSEIGENDKRKYRIPIIFTGGVIKKPMQIERFVSQTDLPKTLLTQMKLNTKEFIYSRDVFNPSSANYAFYVYNNGFSFMDSTGQTIWDGNAKKVIYGEDKKREMKGKVLLQTLYRDIASK